MDYSSIAETLFRIFMWTLVPWAMGALGVALGLSFTPFGRALIDYLKGRRRDTELLEGVLHELGDLRQHLVEMAERMDSTEQKLLRDLNRGPSNRPVEPEIPGPVLTPH